MVAKLYKKGDILIQEITPLDIELCHAAFGVVGELGELFGGVEYAYANRVQIDMANVLEELGDLEFFMENLRTLLGFTRDDVLTCEDVCLVPAGPVRMAGHMLVYATDAMDQIKKAVIYRKEINKKAILTCLSKIEFILEPFRLHFNYSYEQVLEGNMDKLAKRYDGFEYTDQRAQERADKPEEQGGKIIVPFRGIIKP